MSDNVWKGVSLLTSMIIVPLFIWIWNTNTKVETLRLEHQHTVGDVAETKSIVMKDSEEQNDMETDIRLIQQKLDRVEKNTEEVLKLIKGQH